MKKFLFSGLAIAAIALTTLALNAVNANAKNVDHNAAPPNQMIVQNHDQLGATTAAVNANEASEAVNLVQEANPNANNAANADISVNLNEAKIDAGATATNVVNTHNLQ